MTAYDPESLRQPRSKSAPGNRWRRGVLALLALTSSLLLLGASDPKADFIGILQRAVAKELGLDLTLDDVYYDLFGKQWVMTGVALTHPEKKKPFASSPKVIMAADVFAMMGSSTLRFDRIRIESGRLRWHWSKPPVEGPRDSGAKTVHIVSLELVRSRLEVIRAGKTVLLFEGADVTGRNLVGNKGTEATVTGTVHSSSRVTAPSLGIAEHPMDLSVTLGDEVSIHLESLAGGCMVERRFRPGKMKDEGDALARVLDAIKEAAAPCGK